MLLPCIAMRPEDEQMSSLNPFSFVSPRDTTGQSLPAWQPPCAAPQGDLCTHLSLCGHQGTSSGYWGWGDGTCRGDGWWALQQCCHEPSLPMSFPAFRHWTCLLWKLQHLTCPVVALCWFPQRQLWCRSCRCFIPLRSWSKIGIL